MYMKTVKSILSGTKKEREMMNRGENKGTKDEIKGTQSSEGEVS